jgi:hypothetical protein
VPRPPPGDWWHKRGVSDFFQEPIKNKNQSLIDPDHIFNRDRDRDEFFSIRVCLKKINQSLLKIF